MGLQTVPIRALLTWILSTDGSEYLGEDERSTRIRVVWVYMLKEGRDAEGVLMYRLIEPQSTVLPVGARMKVEKDTRN